MKRFIALLLAIFVCATIISFPTAIAAAEDATYLEIDRDNVCLYKNAYRPNALFVIPKTFYVKVLDAEYDSDYWLVEYNGVEGLLKIREVSGKTLENVSNPYFTAQNVSAHINSYLYDKPSFSAQAGVAAYGLTLTYLGKVPGEKGTFGTSTWFAVLYTNQIYYIHSAMTENLDLLEASFAPVHPNSVTATASGTESELSEKESSSPQASFDTVRLLLIIGMIVPIVVILFLLFRPRRRRSFRSNRRDRYDSEEEEYEDDY